MCWSSNCSHRHRLPVQQLLHCSLKLKWEDRVYLHHHPVLPQHQCTELEKWVRPRDWRRHRGCLDRPQPGCPLLQLCLEAYQPVEEESFFSLGEEKTRRGWTGRWSPQGPSRESGASAHAGALPAAPREARLRNTRDPRCFHSPGRPARPVESRTSCRVTALAVYAQCCTAYLYAYAYVQLQSRNAGRQLQRQHGYSQARSRRPRQAVPFRV